MDGGMAAEAEETITVSQIQHLPAGWRLRPASTERVKPSKLGARFLTFPVFLQSTLAVMLVCQLCLSASQPLGLREAERRPHVTVCPENTALPTPVAQAAWQMCILAALTALGVEFSTR